MSEFPSEHIEEWAENATPDQVAAAMREKLRLERRLSDARSEIVATCENDDCDDDSRFPLEDGDSMEPARCSSCEEPYTIRHAPSSEGERDVES